VFLAEGVVLMVLGFVAILAPLVAGLATAILLGWVFVVAGGVGVAATMRARGAPGFGWAMLSAVLALVVGVVLLFNPLRGLVTLTFVMTGFFIADGLIGIFLAIAHKSELSGRWEWMLGSAVLDLVLAGIIISGMPGSFAWALGLLVGIDMIFGGSSLIAMAMAARKESQG